MRGVATLTCVCTCDIYKHTSSESIYKHAHTHAQTHKHTHIYIYIYICIRHLRHPCHMRHARVQRRRRRMLSRGPALGGHRPVVLPIFFSTSTPAAGWIKTKGFPGVTLPPPLSPPPPSIFQVPFIYFGHVGFFLWQVGAGEVRVCARGRERE